MGAAVAASFMPFSTWAAPGLWLLAAVADFGHHAWPRYQQAQQDLALAQACHQDYLPTSGLAFTENFLTRENLGLSDEEYKSQLQLQAKAQRDLTVATIIDVPLAAFGGARLVKNLSHALPKAQLLAQEQNNWREWFSAQAYKTMFDKGLKVEDLSKYSRWHLLKMMAQEKFDFTMLVTFTGFGGAMLAMHLMDQAHPQDDPPHPADLLDIQPISPAQQGKAQTLRHAMLYRLKKMEVLQHNFYLRDFYHGFKPAARPKNDQDQAKDGPKIQFYNGNQIIVLLDTIYLPAQVLAEVNQLYSFEDLMLAVVERVFTERLATAYLMAAVLQHAHQEFWQKVWQGNDGEGGRHFWGRQMMMAAQELMTITNPHWEAEVLQQASTLARQYQLLVAQVIAVERP